MTRKREILVDGQLTEEKQWLDCEEESCPLGE